MKNLRSILFAAALAVIAAGATSCRKTEAPDSEEQIITFRVTPLTRATMNYPIEDYFATRDEVTVNAGSGDKIYKYDSATGLLKPKTEADAIKFAGKTTPLASVTLRWGQLNGIYTDQSSQNYFLSSELLECQLTNLWPASVVPVEFKHTKCKLTFTLGGKMAGKKITALEIDKGILFYSAYCGAETNDAQFMITTDPGHNINDKTAYVTVEGKMYAFKVPVYGQTAGENVTITINL